jgi:hypothetical protein
MSSHILCCFANGWKSNWSNNCVSVHWSIYRALIHNARQSQEQKVRCLVHYFERVTDSTPTGFVSFERKVLPRRAVSGGLTYPDVDAWMKSSAPLCQFRVRGTTYWSWMLLTSVYFGAKVGK